MFRTLIAPENLAPHLADPGWVIFDCRHDLADHGAGRRAYDDGHIPGARFADIEHQLSGVKSPGTGRHPLPALADFVAFLQDSGVDDDTQVVAYDGAAGMYAARLWWMLNWIGHARVAVLDGGLARWSGEKRALSRDAPLPRRGTITARAASVEAVDVNAVADNLRQRSWLVLDARAAERYRGEVETLDPVAGHIPGALNRFYQLNLTAEGRFKPAAELRAEFTRLIGARLPSSVIHQCGSGVTSCHNLLAMEIAGLHGSALYPGSWSEWCADDARPIERGEAPAAH